MRILIPKLIIIFLLTVFLYSCQTKRHGTVKKNYKFEKIKKILVVKFSDHHREPNSGNVVADVFAQKLLALGYDVVSREVISEEYNFETIIAVAKKYEVDVILTGSITKYSIEKNIQAIDKGETEIIVKGGSGEISIRDKKKELIISQGHVYGATSELPYRIPATVGLIAKMIDVETKGVVWSDQVLTTGSTVEYAVEDAVSDLLSFISEE